ncbi:sensor histidine kinase [Flocculibacter collagenilyticus]|uniref:sensor histidine kinase n=1 Tax=Flocculibacter collagenilyticus TaxID=2744479 RepID=UPI0018F59DD8|nr:ATP-binding protein [Flocculibacter collagenilyticus]
MAFTFTHTQQGLVLLAAIPSLLIAAISLWWSGISVYLIICTMIILALVISYATYAVQQNTEQQLHTISNLVEAMIEGDYSLRGRQHKSQAFTDLLAQINLLAETLQQHKMSAQESQLLLEKVIEQMDAMIFSCNKHGQVIMANRAAQRLLFNTRTADTSLSDNVQIAASLLQKLALPNSSGIIELPLIQHHSNGELTSDKRDDATLVDTSCFVYRDSFMSHGTTHQLYLITRADRLLREQERQAWQSLLRVLSHELNNSLAPIISFSHTMRNKLARLAEQQHNTSNDNETQSTINHTLLQFNDGLNIIHERGQSLQRFIAQYSQLTHLPNPQRQPTDWRALINKTCSLMVEADHQLNIDCSQLSQHSTDNALPHEVYVDPQQIEQVLINLLKNAKEASVQANTPDNTSLPSTNTPPIKISAHVSNTASFSTQSNSKKQQRHQTQLHIQIEDSGTGIANLNNLFVPFYTTKTQGSGIGLTLSRQIIQNHNGQLSLKNKLDGDGAVATIVLPLIPTSQSSLNAEK